MRTIIGNLIAVMGIAFLGCAAFVSDVRADIYVLTDEGQVAGELVNRDDGGRKDYVIRTADGAIVTFSRSQIKQIIPQNDAEAEYAKIGPTFADTAADQWRLAEWCQQNSLSRQRKAALERVIELDPENRPARLALEYRQVNGRWITQEQLNREQGKVLYQGQWLLQQEVDVLKRRAEEDQAVKKWFVKLKQLRGRLDDPTRIDQAREELHTIDDPLAAAALIQFLDSERNRQVRIWYIEALAKLATQTATKTLVNHSLDDNDAEIRLTCIQALAGNRSREILPAYVAALKSDDEARISRAGLALGKLGDPSVIPALIEALVTNHKRSIPQGSDNPGAITTTFSKTGGGGGMTMNSGPKIITIEFNSQQVLDALTNLSSGVSFGFDKTRWRTWYASQNNSSTGDSRRD